MTGPAIVVTDLTKSYGPKGLTFSVPRGAISGFLGPNGAGKTTTLRILMGLAHQDSGRAELLGTPAGSTHEIFRRVAFVPEVKDLYPFARVSEMIRLTRGFYPQQWDTGLERRLVGEFAIPLHMKCPMLSKGQRSAVAILLAVCRRPELLVLDEPTDGLDPIANERVLRLFVELAGDGGATVFFSTHHLAEVEQIADHVVMIDGGRAKAAGELDAVRQQFRRVRLAVPDERTPLPAALAGWRRDGRFVIGYSPDDADTLAARLGGTGIAVLEAAPATLKEIFFEEMGAR